MIGCFEIGKQPPGYSRIDPDVSFPDETQCACDETGACCHPDNSCTIETESDCTAGGGTWRGAGSECANVDCSCHLVACCTWETIIKCEPAACPPCGDECYFGDLNVPHLSCVPRDSDSDLGICEEVRDWCTETYYNVCNDLVFVTESMCGTLVASDKSPCGNPSIPAYWFDGTSGNCGDTPPAATRTIVTPSATYTARRLTPGEVAALRAGNPLP